MQAIKDFFNNNKKVILGVAGILVIVGIAYKIYQRVNGKK